MTRIHDGSPLPLLQPATSVHGAGASDRKDEAACSLPSGAGSPARAVLVSYDEFKERRQLRLRVMAAFKKSARERTPDAR
jgi:hypothetical protein